MASFNDFLQTLDPASRRLVDEAGVEVVHPAGTVLCAQGAAMVGFYVVEQGVVEAVVVAPGASERVVAHFTVGDAFGASDLLSGRPSVATLRAHEPVRLRMIEPERFRRLLLRMPGLGVFVASDLAVHFHAAFEEKMRRAQQTDLGGNLRHFDLLLIFQTIIQNGTTGELQLTGATGDVVGCFFFREGVLASARYAHLEGIQAAWQVLLTSSLDGMFAFEARNAPLLAHAAGHAIDRPGMDVLMQAAAYRDHFQSMPEELREVEGMLERVAEPEAFAWQAGPESGILEPGESEALLPMARQVWSFLARRPQSLLSLWQRMAVSRLHLALVVQPMLLSGQARLTAL